MDQDDTIKQPGELTDDERRAIDSALSNLRTRHDEPAGTPDAPRVEPPKPPPYNRTPEGQADLDAAHKTFTLLVDLVEAPSRPPVITRGADLVSIAYSGVRLDFRPLRGQGPDPIWHVQAPGHKGGAWKPNADAPRVSTGRAALAAGIMTAGYLARTAHDKRRAGRWEALVELLHEGARYS